MGVLQKALETYDSMKDLVGVYEVGKEPLAPVGHIVTKAQIEVTINAQGCFITAKAADDKRKIIIPVTEESSGRTSGLAAHPLCEQLGYLLDDDAEKHLLYMAGLKAWVESEHSHPKAQAVYEYMQKGTLAEDLKSVGISITKPDSQDPSKEVLKDKEMVCWRVNGLGMQQSGPVWTDQSLMDAYAAYYLSNRKGEKQLCMLTGENASVTWQHLKGVFALKGNAKIISANDTSNYTYRGRFLEPGEVAALGYDASQKAHNALKWLVANQGTIQGGRAFVCWNPQGLSVPKLNKPINDDDDDDDDDEDEEENREQKEKKKPQPNLNYDQYREDLRKKIEGYQSNWKPSSQVVVAAFDAASKGRLAITYYNELLGSDFLERLAYWDETCCWNDAFRGVSSPLLYNIVAYAFGTPRNPKETRNARQSDSARTVARGKRRGNEDRVEADDKVVAQQMQRLLSCRIDQAAFPLDIMRAIATRANNLLVYTPYQRNNLLFTACAVIRKYYIDHQKEAFELALEPEKRDRSYQWGRLLAVMEKIERDTYDADEKREPNAIRMQSVFVRRPAYAFRIVMEQLKSAYYPRLSPGMRIYYDKLVSQIIGQISQDSEEYAKPLTESYLLGYYLQKSALYTKKDNGETEETNDEV